MHSHISRNTVTGIALSFGLVLVLLLTAFILPAQAAPSDGDQAGAPEAQTLIDTCCVQAEQAEAQVEAERLAAIEAAKPDSVRRAEGAIGTPYMSGSSSPYGFDCSGLVSYCLTGNYGHAYTSYVFWGMPAVSDPQPGDVVACSPGHCGLYIGNGQMIHAPQSGETVRVEAIRGKIVRP